MLGLIFMCGLSLCYFSRNSDEIEAKILRKIDPHIRTSMSVNDIGDKQIKFIRYEPLSDEYSSPFQYCCWCLSHKKKILKIDENINYRTHKVYKTGKERLVFYKELLKMIE